MGSDGCRDWRFPNKGVSNDYSPILPPGATPDWGQLANRHPIVITVTVPEVGPCHYFRWGPLAWSPHHTPRFPECVSISVWCDVAVDLAGSPLVPLGASSVTGLVDWMQVLVAIGFRALWPWVLTCLPSQCVCHCTEQQWWKVQVHVFRAHWSFRVDRNKILSAEVFMVWGFCVEGWKGCPPTL